MSDHRKRKVDGLPVRSAEPVSPIIWASGMREFSEDIVVFKAGVFELLHDAILLTSDGCSVVVDWRM